MLNTRGGRARRAWPCTFPALLSKAARHASKSDQVTALLHTTLCMEDLPAPCCLRSSGYLTSQNTSEVPPPRSFPDSTAFVPCLYLHLCCPGHDPVPTQLSSPPMTISFSAFGSQLQHSRCLPWQLPPVPVMPPVVPCVCSWHFSQYIFTCVFSAECLSFL